MTERTAAYAEEIAIASWLVVRIEKETRNANIRMETPIVHSLPPLLVWYAEIINGIIRNAAVKVATKNLPTTPAIRMLF